MDVCRFLCQALKRGFVDVDDENLRTIRGELPRNGQTDSAGAGRHQHSLTHASLPTAPPRLQGDDADFGVLSRMSSSLYLDVLRSCRQAAPGSEDCEL